MSFELIDSQIYFKQNIKSYVLHCVYQDAKIFGSYIYTSWNIQLPAGIHHRHI